LSIDTNGEKSVTIKEEKKKGDILNIHRERERRELTLKLIVVPSWRRRRRKIILVGFFSLFLVRTCAI
jgi:hypothetical protein